MTDEIIQPMEWPLAEFPNIRLCEVSVEWIEALLFFAEVLGRTHDIHIDGEGGCTVAWEKGVETVASLTFDPADKAIAAQGSLTFLSDRLFFALAGFCTFREIDIQLCGSDI